MPSFLQGLWNHPGHGGVLRPLRNRSRTFFFRGNSVPDVIDALPKLGLSSAELGKRRCELREVLSELILELSELWAGHS